MSVTQEQTAIRVVDADTHLTEPADLWTARIPERFRDQAPRVQLDEATGKWRWRIGDRWCSLVGNYSMAGRPAVSPAGPPPPGAARAPPPPPAPPAPGHVPTRPTPPGRP